MRKTLGFVFLASAVLFTFTVQAETRPTALGTAELAQQVSDFLHVQVESYGGEAQIVVEPPQVDRLPACLQAQVFLPSGARVRPRLSVGIRCLAPQDWVSYTQASIVIEGDYYVASRGLPPGTVLGDDDLVLRHGDLLRLANGAVVERDLLLGSITTRRIGAGSLIKTQALRSAQSVERGQNVRLEARGAGFVATSDGKALQGGEPGTQIQVRTASGQTVSGTVLNSHTVLVFL